MKRENHEENTDDKEEESQNENLHAYKIKDKTYIVIVLHSVDELYSFLYRKGEEDASQEAIDEIYTIIKTVLSEFDVDVLEFSIYDPKKSSFYKQEVTIEVFTKTIASEKHNKIMESLVSHLNERGLYVNEGKSFITNL